MSIETLAPKVIVPGHGRILRDSAVLLEISRMKEFIEAAIEQGRAPTAL